MFFDFLLTYRITHRDFLKYLNWFFIPARATRFHSAQSTAIVVNVANADNWATEYKQIFQCVETSFTPLCAIDVLWTGSSQWSNRYIEFQIGHRIFGRIIFLDPLVVFTHLLSCVKHYFNFRYCSIRSCIEIELLLWSSPLHLNCVFWMCSDCSQLQVVFHRKRKAEQKIKW